MCTCQILHEISKHQRPEVLCRMILGGIAPIGEFKSINNATSITNLGIGLYTYAFGNSLSGLPSGVTSPLSIIRIPYVNAQGIEHKSTYIIGLAAAFAYVRRSDENTWIKII